MKKLLLPLPLILFGCSKDRNYDGEVTISDYVIFFENLCISIGKFTVGILNALIDTDLGKFFELNKINPYGDTLFNFGAGTIIILAILTFFISSLND